MRDVRRGHAHAYSDRRVRRLDGRPLTDDERDELDRLEGVVGDDR